jgi:hypothetical protein
MVMVIRGRVREGWPKTRKPRTMDMHGMCTRTFDECHQRSAYSDRGDISRQSIQIWLIMVSIQNPIPSAYTVQYKLTYSFCLNNLNETN